MSFKALDDDLVDTTSRTGKLVTGMLALIAEFENSIRKERQMDGIAKAKSEGVQFGRKPLPDAVKENLIRLRNEDGKTIPQIIKATGLSKATIYRVIGRRDMSRTESG